MTQTLMFVVTADRLVLTTRVKSILSYLECQVTYGPPCIIKKHNIQYAAELVPIISRQSGGNGLFDLKKKRRKCNIM